MSVGNPITPLCSSSPRPYSHQPQSSGPPNNSTNRAAQLQLPPEPAPQPSTATIRLNTRDAFLAGFGQPPQPQNNNQVDLGYPAAMTLQGIGGQGLVGYLHLSFTLK